MVSQFFQTYLEAIQTGAKKNWTYSFSGAIHESSDTNTLNMQTGHEIVPLANTSSNSTIKTPKQCS